MEFCFFKLTDSASQAGDAASASTGARAKSHDAEVSGSKTCGSSCTGSCASACARSCARAASSRVERAGYCSAASAGPGHAGATVFAFGCGNQLNHFFGAAEPFLDAVGVSAQSLCCKGGGDARVGKARVFGDEANLVDADAGMRAVGEMDGEAVGEGCGLGAGFDEALHQIRELLALDAGEETDASHS